MTQQVFLTMAIHGTQTGQHVLNKGKVAGFLVGHPGNVSNVLLSERQICISRSMQVNDLPKLFDADALTECGSRQPGSRALVIDLLGYAEEVHSPSSSKRPICPRLR